MDYEYYYLGMPISSNNPNLVKIPLLDAELKLIKQVLEKEAEAHATRDERNFLFYPIIKRIDLALEKKEKERRQNWEKES